MRAASRTWAPRKWSGSDRGSGLKFGRGGAGRTALLSVVAQAEAVKSATAEIAHAAGCGCRHGEGPAEPALPASAYRKAEAR